MGRLFKRFLFGSITAAFLLFFGLLYFMKAAVGEGTRQIELLSYNHEVVIVLQDVLISLQRAESSRRGFIITNNRDFIKDYNSAVKSVQQSFLYLKQLNVKGSYRDEFLDSLGTSINGRIEIIKSSINLAMTNSSSDSLQAVLTDKGKELMGSIRTTILALMTEKQNSRDDSYRALERIGSEVDALYEIAVVIVIIFGGGLTAGAFFFFRRLDREEVRLQFELYHSRQQVQHAMSRYQDLKVELTEKMKSGENHPPPIP
ncbi:MAG: CHASE3 domain-containing protein [Bacteroidota bacterium]